VCGLCGSVKDVGCYAGHVTKDISPWQFVAFRVALGGLLAAAIAVRLPGGRGQRAAGLAVMLAAAIGLTLGTARRMACGLLLAGWAWLHADGRLAEPGVLTIAAAIGLAAVVPLGEPLRVGRRIDRRWDVPWIVLAAAWAVLAAGYAAEGLDRLLAVVTEHASPLAVARRTARPGPLAGVPVPEPALAALAWAVVVLDVAFAPMCLWRRTRPMAWTLGLVARLGVVLAIDFDAAGFGPIMLHVLTFDPDWLPARRPAAGRAVVFYDGVCALCHATVRWLLDEDRDGVLAYAPLQGETFATVRETIALPEPLDSIVYVRGVGTATPRVAVRSTAVLEILADLGGAWRIVSWARVIPRPVRDAVYDLVARYRYRWFGRYETCRVPRAGEASRLLP